MKFSIKAIIILLFLCSFTNHVFADFEKFKQTFNKITLPLCLNDSTIFTNWSLDKLIDTTYVHEYHLIDKYIDKEYPFKNISSYQCSKVGEFETNIYILIIYKAYTSEAGRGNPKVILATFSKTGKKIDETVVLWNDAEDPLYNNRISVVIDENKIKIQSFLHLSGYLGGKIVPRRTTEKKYRIQIKRTGKFNKSRSKEKVIFYDNNPKILNNFP